MSFTIIGTGRALPELVVSNDLISTIVETSDEWITTRTGIKNRYISTDETLLDLAVGAAKMALTNAKVDANELDLIICSTIGSEYLTPSLACLVQRDIGAQCPAFDINAACTGFIYALDIAAAYFAGNRAKKVLIVSAEMMSNYVDWQDKSTCVLFGDGAGAVVLTGGDGLLGIRVSASGDDKLLTIGGAAGNSPFNKKSKTKPFLSMTGQEVFKFAVGSMCHDIQQVLQEANLELGDVCKILPHQANIRIIQSAKEKLGLKEDKIICGIDKYGNTSSASIPIILSELMDSGELKGGEILVLAAFGGGLTSGACIIKI